MERDRVAPYVGAVGCLVLASLLSIPYAVIDTQPGVLGAYYNAGPIGIVGVIFLSILGIVIFLSSVRGRADAELIAGIMLVVGVVIFGMTALWAGWLLAVDPASLYSFPAEYAWIEYHPWAALAVSGVVAAAGGLYATAVR
ncbi:MAG: DUF7548 family protein [Halohasta sp.]